MSQFGKIPNSMPPARTMRYLPHAVPPPELRRKTVSLWFGLVWLINCLYS